MADIKINSNFFPALKKKAEKALIESAEAVKDNSKKVAPVDTGELRKSIKIDKSNSNNLEVKIGSELPYAHITEFGGIVNGTRRTANPYLRPGLKMSKVRIKRIFGK